MYDNDDMEYSFDDDPDVVAALRVSFDALRYYLNVKGWLHVLGKNGFVDVYRRPDGEPFRQKIVVPTKEYELKCENERVAYILDAARVLAFYRNKDLLDVLDEVVAERVPYDRFRCRLVSPDVVDGSLRLVTARDFLSGLTSLFSAAVKDAISPSIRHKRVHSSEIKELLNAARFGQTERGSFVANVAIPVGRSDDDARFPEARETFFRRASERMMKTLAEAVAADDAGRGDAFAQENEESDAPTSANFFESFGKILSLDDSAFEIAVDWSPTRSSAPNVPSSVRVEKKHADAFKRWVARYDAKSGGTEARPFVVRVDALDVDEEGERRVVRFRVFDGVRNENFEAEGTLDEGDFKKAWESYLDPNALFYLRAKLERNARKATLSDIVDFCAVRPSADF